MMKSKFRVKVQRIGYRDKAPYDMPFYSEVYDIDKDDNTFLVYDPGTYDMPAHFEWVSISTKYDANYFDPQYGHELAYAVTLADDWSDDHAEPDH